VVVDSLEEGHEVQVKDILVLFVISLAIGLRGYGYYRRSLDGKDWNVEKPTSLFDGDYGEAAKKRR